MILLEKRQQNPRVITHMHTVIIHDRDIFCRGLRSLLSMTPGFEKVTELSTTNDLFTLLGSQSADLVILDDGLSVAECLETIRRLRVVSTSLSIVLLSAFLDEELLVEVVLAGANGFLTKDTPDVDVIKALRSLQRGGLALCPRLSALLVALLVQRCHTLATLAAVPLATQQVLLAEETLPDPGVPLTLQEAKVFQGLRQGLTNKQIAAQLGISPYTVSKHVQHILHKLGASNRTQAVTQKPVLSIS